MLRFHIDRHIICQSPLSGPSHAYCLFPHDPQILASADQEACHSLCFSRTSDHAPEHGPEVLAHELLPGLAGPGASSAGCLPSSSYHVEGIRGDGLVVQHAGATGQHLALPGVLQLSIVP